MAGWEDVGSLLGLGARKDAAYDKAYSDGRYRSAQTEEALANAKVSQAKAIRAQTENDADTALKAMQATKQVDYANPTSDLITQALLGGRAGELPNVGKYNLQAQEFRNRDAIASPTATPVQRLQAAGGVQGEVQNPIQAVGSKGYVDLSQETPELAVMAGLDSGSVPADLQVFDRLQALGGANSPLGRELMDVRRNQYKVSNFGDVPTQVRTGASPQVTQLAAPSQIAADKATIAGATAGAKTTATTQAKLANALPGVVESLDTFQTSIDDFMNSPGFDMLYGKSGAAAGALGPMAPEEYRNAKALLSNLTSQAFLNSIQKARGLGALSDAEGEKFQAALTSALDPNQDETQAAKSFTLLKQRLDRFRRVAEIEAGLKGVPGMTVNSGLRQPAAPQAFATEEEAAAAGIAPGTRVVIGGVSGVWE